ncbi:MAG TPA: hypothetical protein DDY68_03025 [Porphyromonadaceae bacterium]|nr:hypothetical protein [Porphyromonadaceae bacterium]
MKKSEELITAIFKDVLGEVYKGNISLQALLAMCSHANFSKSREDLISNQRKLLKYFGSADEILKFSHFKEIEELVYEKSIHFTDEIIEANKQKMISMIRRSHNKLNDTIKNQEEKTKKFRLLLRNFKHDASDAIHSTKNRIVSEIDAIINRRMNAIMYGIDEIIDNNQDDKEKSAKAIADKEMNGMNEDIREMIQKSISGLKDKLTKMKHHLNAEYCNSMSLDDGVMGNVCMDLNFDTAMSEMDISFGDCMDFLGSVIGFAGIGSFFTFLFPGLATILGGVVGGILYGVRKIFGDGGRAKAKEEAHKSIQQSKEEIKSKMRKATNDMSNNLLIFNNSICELIDKELHALKKMESMINESKNKMVENVNSLKQTEYGKL